MSALAALILAAAAAARVDCPPAPDATSQLLCNDAAQAAEEQRLDAVYTEVRRAAPRERDALQRGQRTWLQRRACRVDHDCLQGPPAEAAAPAPQCRSSSCWLDAFTRRRIADLLVLAPAFSGRGAPSANEIASARVLFALMTPRDLALITNDANRERLSALSCDYFAQAPDAAQRLFAPYFDGGRDRTLPLCPRRAGDAVPALAALTAALREAYSPSCNHSLDAVLMRQQHLAELAAINAAPPPATQPSLPQADLGYTPDLDHYAQQGLWQQRLVARIRRAESASRLPLQQYYRRRHGLAGADAAALADYHLSQLIKKYTGHVGRASTGHYASACYGRADLDAWLATGTLPQRRCPGHENAAADARRLRGFLLTLAIVDGYPAAAVQGLLAAGAELEPPQFPPGETALMRAAGRSDVIALLLAAGADANRGNGFGKTALMHAVAEDDAEGVRTLLAAGADVNAATRPLADLQLECYALRAGRRSVLMYAAWQASPPVLQLLLQAGADPLARDDQGETALAYLGRNTRATAAQRERMRQLLRTRSGSAAHGAG